MRIVTYLVLLALLALTAVSVFIVTQNGSYVTAYSHVIKTPRLTVFDYVNDYKNWETFSQWKKEDAQMVLTYPEKTYGKGASFRWTGNSTGAFQTVFIRPNDSIAQVVYVDGNRHTLHWKFEETPKGTLIKCSMKGKAGLMDKITSFWDGGFAKVQGRKLQKTLIALDKTLDYEMKTYAIKVNGVTTLPAQFFIKQTFSCRIRSVERNIKVVLPKLVYFFKKNQLKMNGNPFVMYERYDLSNDIATLSVCIPTTQLVHVASESDISTGQSEAFTSIKTTLKGDYSHLRATWQKAEQYIKDKAYQHNFAGFYVEVYVQTIDEVKNPSQWITELYIPVFPKVEKTIPVPPVAVTTPVPQVTIPTSTPTDVPDSE